MICLLGLASPPPRLRVDIVLEGLPLRAQIRNPALEEASGIWAKYGVDVRLWQGDSVSTDHVVRLTVVEAAHHSAQVPTDALGSILFIEDSPEPVIRMYDDAIRDLVGASALPTYASQSSPLHDVIVGRVLGRALAHEIGHYLLRWRHHSSMGLMRARQSAMDLVSPERRPFTLSNDELMRLESVMSISSRLRSNAVGEP